MKGLFRNKGKSLAELSKEQLVILSFKEDNIKSQVSLIGLSKKDLQIVKQLRPVILPHLEEIVDEFYSKILLVPALKEIIYENSTPDTLRKRLVEHIAEMLEGNFDEEYIQRRIKISHAHYKINLQPNWYMGAFQLVQDAIMKFVEKEVESKEDCHLIFGAITRMFNFEQQLVLDEYHKNYMQGVVEANNKVREEVKNKIGATSMDLAAVSEETQASMEELMVGSNEVASTVTHAAEHSSATRELARTGYTLMESLNDKIQQIHASAQDMHKMIEHLNDSSSEVQGVLEIVKGIAEQTNLLSLNSSIEAARAGVHGKGFAVVAAEIRKLSDETKNSITRITELLNQNDVYIKGSVNTLYIMEEKIEEGNKDSIVTKTSFAEIVSSMDECISYVDRAVSEVKGLINGLTSIEIATEGVVKSADQLNETAQQI